MSRDYIGQINDPFPNVRPTHVRYIVKDKVKTQVVDSQRDKVIREIPQQFSSNILKTIYA